MSSSLDACPEQYVQLTIFHDDGSVRWTRSFPSVLPPQLHSEIIRVFRLSCSISDALRSGPAIHRKEERSLSAELCDTPYSDRHVAVETRNQLKIAALPLKTESSTWLGLFVRTRPEILLEDVSKVLPAVANACFFLSKTECDVYTRLSMFWRVLYDFKSQLTAVDERTAILSTIQYLWSIGQVTPVVNEYMSVIFMETPVSPTTRLPREVRSQADSTILSKLRAAIHDVGRTCLASVCILSPDGHVHFREKMCAAQASIISWRYRARPPAYEASQCYEWQDGILLRAWYRSDSFAICVNTSHSPAASYSCFTPSSLDQMALVASQLMSRWQARLSTA